MDFHFTLAKLTGTDARNGGSSENCDYSGKLKVLLLDLDLTLSLQRSVKRMLAKGMSSNTS